MAITNEDVLRFSKQSQSGKVPKFTGVTVGQRTPKKKKKPRTTEQRLRESTPRRASVLPRTMEQRLRESRPRRTGVVGKIQDVLNPEQPGTRSVGINTGGFAGTKGIEKQVGIVPGFRKAGGELAQSGREAGEAIRKEGSNILFGDQPAAPVAQPPAAIAPPVAQSPQNAFSGIGAVPGAPTREGRINQAIDQNKFLNIPGRVVAGGSNKGGFIGGVENAPNNIEAAPPPIQQGNNPIGVQNIGAPGSQFQGSSEKALALMGLRSTRGATPEARAAQNAEALRNRGLFTGTLESRNAAREAIGSFETGERRAGERVQAVKDNAAAVRGEADAGRRSAEAIAQTAADAKRDEAILGNELSGGIEVSRRRKDKIIAANPALSGKDTDELRSRRQSIIEAQKKQKDTLTDAEKKQLENELIAIDQLIDMTQA